MVGPFFVILHWKDGVGGSLCRKEWLQWIILSSSRFISHQFPQFQAHCWTAKRIGIKISQSELMQISHTFKYELFGFFKTFFLNTIFNQSIIFWIKIDPANSVKSFDTHTQKKRRFFHIFSRSTRGFNRNLPGEHKWQTIVYDRHWPHSVTKNGAHISRVKLLHPW